MAMDSKTLWMYSHSASIFFAALLFLASFLCVLLWTNGIVPSASTASSDATSNTLTTFSPPVTTFTITYGVAIFGVVWNSLMFITLTILERDVLPISTIRLRYEIEKAACIVSVVGNAIYSVACFALLSTLARLAADQSNSSALPGAGDRAAGQGVSAAMAGFAGAAAVWAAFMDGLHSQSSSYRRIVKDEPSGDADITEAEKAPRA